MGRRSRKRGLSQRSADDQEARQPAPTEAAKAKPERRRARLKEAPRPPWAPVPLTEICILVGIIVVTVALFGASQRGLLIGFGLALILVATLELTLREHLSGYRSHSVLIAACASVLLCLPLALITGLSKNLLLAAAALIFGLGWTILRSLFRNRSGGMSWRA
jgi:hypothetical protein